jgi:hypothetical protein
MSTILFEFSPNQKLSKDSNPQNSTQKLLSTDFFSGKKANQVKKKFSKSKNLKSINLLNSVQQSEHLRKSSSVTRTRKVTVTDLLPKVEEPQKTERSEKSEEKNQAKRNPFKTFFKKTRSPELNNRRVL